MISKDHRLLGEFLAQQMIKNTSPLATHLFVTGCVFPDHNPWTYLRGLYMGYPLKTHFLFLSYPEIQRLCNKLENRKKLYLWDYYTLGVLLHYVADAFTFPHNEHYTGNMLEHAQYEHAQLHQTFEQYLTGEFHIEMYAPDHTQPIGSAFLALHDSYMETEPTALCDAKYICQVCTMICARVLEKESVSGTERSNGKKGVFIYENFNYNRLV